MFKFSDFLLEAHCKVILDLISLYGREIVYNSNRDFKVDSKIVKDIYASLNMSFFSNRLPKDLHIEYCSTSQILKELSKRNPNVDFSKRSPLGCYLTTVKIIANSTDIDNLLNYTITGNETVEFSNNILMINSDLVQNQTFIFTVNCICHEMIHCFDDFYGDTTKLVLLQLVHNVKIDEHTTPTFEQKVKEARKNRMKIITKIKEDYYDFDVLNKEAYDVLTEDKNHPVKLIAKDKKYYVDMLSYGQIGLIYPIDRISANFICLD